MGFSTVFASIAFILIFASMITFATVIQKNMTTSVTQQQEQTATQRKQSETRITITAAEYEYAAAANWEDDIYQDFARGSFSDTEPIGPGSVILNGTPYVNGSYASQAIDTGFTSSNFTTIAWTSIQPAGTSVSFQTRAANSTTDLANAAFTGPDGTPATAYTVSGDALHGANSDNRFIQYLAFLNTTSELQTPELQQVTIGVRRAAGHVQVNITNVGSEPLLPAHTDLYVGHQRIERNDTKRILTTHDSVNLALWEPGENITITAFISILAPTQITVANNVAKSSTTVTP